MSDSLAYAEARQAALKSGLSRYVGKPCAYGHSERYVSTGSCVACLSSRPRNDPGASDRVRRWRESHPAATAQASAAGYDRRTGTTSEQRTLRRAMHDAASTLGRLAAAMGTAGERVRRDTRRHIMAPMTDAQRRRYRALERVDLD